MLQFFSIISRRVLLFFDSLFDKIYGSRWNPLYQSGAITVGLIFIVIITGFYLLFFYKLGTPFESMQLIQQQNFSGAWIRALHRYASDASLFTMGIHVLRMIAEKKTWGPRFLAWISGVFLALFMMIIGWTGYILVWDQNAQSLIENLVRWITVIPFFQDSLRRLVSGTATIGPSFFFLNLFLHMSLPLGMVFGLWIHTMKLNKPLWFPNWKYLGVTTLFFIIFSVLKFAPLDQKANFLNLSYDYHLDFFYSFFLLLDPYLSPTTQFTLSLLLVLFLFFVPALLREKKNQQSLKSKHNPDACTGCQQCSTDCPFDSIEMRARSSGKGSDEVAFVLEDSCVGCGICSGSCSQLAIGPEDKSAQTQIQKIKELKGESTQKKTLVIVCVNNSEKNNVLSNLRNKNPNMEVIEFSCLGILHIATVAYAQKHFQKVVLISCYENACENRTGVKLLKDRIFLGREPKAPSFFNYSQVQLIEGTSAETVSDTDMNANTSTRNLGPIQILKITVGTFILIFGLSSLSGLKYSRVFEGSLLRVAFRMPAPVEEVCRERTQDELNQIPLHMRKKLDCSRKSIDFNLRVSIDEKIILQKKIESKGVQSDRPLIVDEDLKLGSGEHQVRVELVPIEQNLKNDFKLKYEFHESFEEGHVQLVELLPNTNVLTHSKTH